MSNNVVIYHASCIDGFCSAWVANKYLPKGTAYVPMHYGDNLPDVDGKDVYVLDFSLRLPDMEDLYSRTESLLVLDHHRTAERQLRDLPYCIFNMDKSGAMMTWDYFSKCKDPPWIVSYVQDYDLWNKSLDYTDEVSLRIKSLPYDFVKWDALSRTPFDKVVSEGRAIKDFTNRCIDDLIRNHKKYDFLNFSVPVINNTCSKITSEALNILCESNPFAVSWFASGTGEMIFSLRSKREGVDVGDLCSNLGGGGHYCAAGFKAQAEDYFFLLK